MQKSPSKKNDKKVGRVATDGSGSDPINTGHGGSGGGHIKTAKPKESGKVKK